MPIQPMFKREIVFLVTYSPLLTHFWKPSILVVLPELVILACF